MSEPKQVYRLPPCHSFDIAATESWLEDMAARGYILAKDSFFGGVATFELGPPQKIRYRLEATDTPSGLFSPNYDPEDDLIQLYHQMGWQYRGRRGQFFIFATSDPDAPELNTDPRIQAHTIQALAKYQRRQVVNTLFYWLFIGWLHFSSILLSGTIAIGTPAMLLLLGLTAESLIRQITIVLRLEKLKKRLHSGETMPHKSDYTSRTLPYYSGKLIRFALWILAFTLVFVHFPTDADAIALTEHDGSFPFATLQELYPEAEITPWESFMGSEVTAWSDFLAPVCYEYTESSYVKLPDAPKDSMWLSVHYFDTRWEWTARILSRELVHQAGASPVHQFFDELFGDEPIIVTELDLPGVDYAAYYYRYRSFPYVVLRKGTQVLKANIDIFGEDTAFTPEEFALTMADSMN